MTQAVKMQCMNLDMMPLLSLTLQTALSLWFQHDPSSSIQFQMPVAGASKELRRLLFEPNQIGWDHLFQERFSQSWSTMQDAYYARRRQSTESSKRTGSTWQVRIICTIWQQWMLSWSMRNQDLHGNDKRTKAEAERKEVEREFTAIYDLRNQFEPSVQQVLC